MGIEWPHATTFEEEELRMGLMDNIKNAQQQAQEMAQQAMAGAGGAAAGGMDAGDVAQAQMMQRISSEGTPGTAVIKSISETGKTDMGGAKQYAIDVEITRDGVNPYDATFHQNLQENAV